MVQAPKVTPMEHIRPAMRTVLLFLATVRRMSLLTEANRAILMARATRTNLMEEPVSSVLTVEQAKSSHTAARMASRLLVAILAEMTSLMLTAMDNLALAIETRLLPILPMALRKADMVMTVQARTDMALESTARRPSVTQTLAWAGSMVRIPATTDELVPGDKKAMDAVHRPMAGSPTRMEDSKTRHLPTVEEMRTKRLLTVEEMKTRIDMVSRPAATAARKLNKASVV
jgi:hypothetical protein